MFTAVTVRAAMPCKGFRGIRAVLCPPRPKIEQRRTQGIPWRLIVAYAHRRGVPWKEIAKMAHPHAKCLVMQKELSVPQDCGIIRFDPLKLRQSLAVNALLHALPEHPVRVGVVDACGGQAELIQRLVEGVGDVVVYTQAVGRYERFAELMMLRYGAPVMFSDSPTVLRGCDAVVVLSGDEDWWGYSPRGCVVVSAEDGCGAKGRWLADCFEAAPPDWWSEDREISPTDLLGAMYNAHPTAGLSAIMPCRCRVMGQNCDTEQFLRLSNEVFRQIKTKFPT